MTRPVREENLDRLLPGHRILTADGEHVVDTVTRTATEWEVAARPAGRPTGRRIVHRFDLGDDAFVIRLADAQDMALIRAQLDATVCAAAELHHQRASSAKVGEDVPPRSVSIGGADADVEDQDLVLNVETTTGTWTVRI